MSNYSRIRAYLEAHPTPWRVEQVNFDKSADRVEQIVDANGVVVVGCEDAESFQAVFTPKDGAQTLVDFVNLVGEEYEPQHGWPGLEGEPYDYGVKFGPLTPGQRQEIRDEYARRFTAADAEWLDQAGHLLDEEETWQPATNGYEVSTRGRARTSDGVILAPTRIMGGRNVYQLPDGVELIAPARKRDWDKP